MTDADAYLLSELAVRILQGAALIAIGFIAGVIYASKPKR
jgi:hypothetical protein